MTTSKTTSRTTSAKSARTPAKPRAPRKTAAVRPAAAPAPEPAKTEDALHTAVAATLDPTLLPPAMQPELKKRELIDKVVRRSGVKKRDAKPAIEAALEILGEALAEGRDLNVKPFGKMKVQRVRDTGNGQVLVTKVRQPQEAEKDAPDPLAQAAE
ncbi:integration host factor subunit alpha [Roseivivax sp. THAF40]|uniref:HU family DNA-binding protein n=1 Tax=unclassified Roseivivax TaxID=2639302 RepID=UPI0012A8DDB0|nr:MULTISPECIES: HU family DNA-binding protein [unclassified Roseivivax]QFS82243.1 integration host factor subunit alpha [Roseivivax sp. THAF197b]QFT46043.1 integration host factor subunit alpha [Roseivivax sp. THAF40]